MGGRLQGERHCCAWLVRAPSLIAALSQLQLRCGMGSVSQKRPSLENLVESEDLGFEILHPGGLEITRELATLCHIEKDSKILDVAAGTGESACYLQENFGSQVIGIDASDHMVERARNKRAERALSVEFQRGDAHSLPFEDNTFDAVISECTTCILDKDRAIREMVRVARPGGYVGIHDLCWKEGTSEHLKQRLAELARLRGFGGCRARKWLKNRPVGLQGLHYKAVAEVA